MGVIEKLVMRRSDPSRGTSRLRPRAVRVLAFGAVMAGFGSISAIAGGPLDGPVSALVSLVLLAAGLAVAFSSGLLDD